MRRKSLLRLAIRCEHDEQDPYATITTMPSRTRQAGPRLAPRPHRLTQLGEDEIAVRQALLIHRGEFSPQAMDWGTT
ncbi:hypothetical protein [Streptomyces goshikiensis]|uniref:hypothetical protein n=1 Tax=Streptomyces goshikiensis TaxID=1942 RepID=UPI00365ABF28